MLRLHRYHSWRHVSSWLEARIGPIWDQQKMKLWKLLKCMHYVQRRTVNSSAQTSIWPCGGNYDCTHTYWRLGRLKRPGSNPSRRLLAMYLNLVDTIQNLHTSVNLSKVDRNRSKFSFMLFMTTIKRWLDVKMMKFPWLQCRQYSWNDMLNWPVREKGQTLDDSIIFVIKDPRILQRRELHLQSLKKLEVYGREFSRKFVAWQVQDVELLQASQTISKVGIKDIIAKIPDISQRHKLAVKQTPFR